ncbi:hypothetical protein [Sphingomonas sp. Mn802worker]|uniref:hypothetical protein n=1 Tax=Sphingomonas sp. Mn802worker TaxID=629773 RepID=UPI0003614EFE|nr:hypothetical protein [Sphingomonas sp. Mn802worker]
MLLIAFAVQAAAAVTPLPAVPERISILAPVPDERCTRKQGDEIVVCANALPSQTLPLPNEAVSDRPVPINGYLTGRGALNAQGTPCAARMGGCQTGVDVVGPGVALVRGIQKLIAPDSCCENPGESTSAGQLASDMVDGVKKLFRGKPDKSNRVAILLDDTPLATSRVLP